MGADGSLDGGKSGKKGDLFGSSKKLQRDISVRSIQSKLTADTLTMEGSLMAGPFKFGVQKSYRPLNEMDSRQTERKKAETTLKLGKPLKLAPAVSKDSIKATDKTKK